MLYQDERREATLAKPQTSDVIVVAKLYRNQHNIASASLRRYRRHRHLQYHKQARYDTCLYSPTQRMLHER